jgi:hypothetical protein
MDLTGAAAAVPPAVDRGKFLRDGFLVVPGLLGRREDLRGSVTHFSRGPSARWVAVNWVASKNTVYLITLDPG